MRVYNEDNASRHFDHEREKKRETFGASRSRHELEHAGRGGLPRRRRRRPEGRKTRKEGIWRRATKKQENENRRGSFIGEEKESSGRTEKKNRTTPRREKGKRD